MPRNGMTDDEKGRLKSSHATLVEELMKQGIEKLLDRCLQVDLLTDNQYEDLLESQTTKDNKARKFLNMVKKSRKKDAFDLLCKSLKEADFDYAAGLPAPSSITPEFHRTLSRDNAHVSLYVCRLLTSSGFFDLSVVYYNFQPVVTK